MNQRWETILLLALAGGIGALARHWMVAQAGQRAGTVPFPGTVAVNLLGALLAGGLSGWLQARPPTDAPAGWPLIVSLGFLGAFTTYSSWVVQGIDLKRSRNGWLPAGLFLAGTLTMGVILAWVGWWCGGRL